MPDVEKKRQGKLLYVLSLLYLLVSYSLIIYYLSYTIRIANKLEGWVFMLFNTLLCFIAYIAINHIFIKKIISSKLLIFIEVLLFVAILTLIISDWMYEDYLHLRYLQRTMQVAGML